MIHELSRISPAELFKLSAELGAGKEDPKYVTLQTMSDNFAALRSDVLETLNILFADHPILRLRLYSASKRDPVDLENLRALTALRHLELHYGVPAVKDTTPLTALTMLESAEVEIIAPFSFDFLTHWQHLQKLSIIRLGKASRKPDFGCIKELPKLSTFSTTGYHNGIAALTDVKSLRALHVQEITVKDWDFIPSHQLDALTLNKVNGPPGFDFRSLSDRAKTVKLLRMDKHAAVDVRRVIKPSRPHSAGRYCTVDIDYLSNFEPEYLNGHDWAALLEKEGPPMGNVRFDPEAGHLSFHGEARDVSQYHTALMSYFVMRYPKGEASDT